MDTTISCHGTERQTDRQTDRQTWSTTLAVALTSLDSTETDV